MLCNLVEDDRRHGGCIASNWKFQEEVQEVKEQAANPKPVLPNPNF
jgi:hypothetical protein